MSCFLCGMHKTLNDTFGYKTNLVIRLKSNGFFSCQNKK